MDNFEISPSDAYILTTFDQSNVDDWGGVAKSVGRYIIMSNPPLIYKRFPGFIFDSSIKARAYYCYIFSNYIGVETPPRGNLISSLKYIFIGYKPGTKNSDLSRYESAWLFGPTANILDNLLEEFQIYPYFTNLAHDRHATSFDLSQIINEITFIRCAISKNVRCVFLGRYKEYDEVIEYCRNALGIRCIQIWHPAYIYRNGNSEKLYKEWINMFEKGIENE